MSNKSRTPGHPSNHARRKRVKTGTFAVRTLQSLAASTLGKMALGKKKTMTPAALEARRRNGFQPKNK